ncbi:MAG: uncharacterized protein JWM36_3192 [Hyphomicrobiales bacterium]|nr:uncharacterized protein [Hyphomicrobiales bacterium]
MNDEHRILNAKIWDRHPDDWYVEPEWVSERLFATEKFEGNVYDPACGMGRILKAAAAAGLEHVGSDLIMRSESCRMQMDFLTEAFYRADNIVSNPPFKHAEAFVVRALERATGKVAMLLPSKWMHGDKRSRWLETTPLRRVLYITPRPSMPPGPVIEAGINPGGGKEDFAWFIWLRGYDGRPESSWLRREA